MVHKWYMNKWYIDYCSTIGTGVTICDSPLALYTLSTMNWLFPRHGNVPR